MREQNPDIQTDRLTDGAKILFGLDGTCSKLNGKKKKKVPVHVLKGTF